MLTGNIFFREGWHQTYFYILTHLHVFLTQTSCYFINHRRLELIKHSSISDEADGIQNEERAEKIKNMFAFIRKSAELCSIELKEWINVDNISPWIQFAM